MDTYIAVLLSAFLRARGDGETELAESEPAKRDLAWKLPGWASASDALTLRDSFRPSSLLDVADRQLLLERVARYCWAYDERRADRLADCFTNDAIWTGTVQGKIPIGPFAGRDKIVTWLTEFWPHQHDQRRHMLLNNLVEEHENDHARTLSYLLLVSTDGTTTKLECTGFYHCTLRKCEEVWLISKMTAGFDAPFWPGELKHLSPRGRVRHGIDQSEHD